MSRYKNRLTRDQQADYFAAVWELQAQGVAIELPEEGKKQAEGVDVNIGMGSQVYVLHDRILYALNVQLVSRINNSSFDGFDIIADWDDGVDCDLNEPPYRFAGLEFGAEEVLNQRFWEVLRLRREGDRIEGWLLGMGRFPVPKQFGPGKPAPITLRLFPLNHTPFDTGVMLGVDRSVKVAGWFDELDSKLHQQLGQEHGRAERLRGPIQKLFD
jgi:hypothetical protein